LNVELLLPLVALALVDSTSFGTLLIPLWLMLGPSRPKPGRIAVFLGSVAGFYLVLGVVLATGATAFLGQFGPALDGTPARVVRLVAGMILMALGATIEPWTKAGKARRVARRAAREATRGPGRLTRWRARAVSDGRSTGSMVALAVTAAAVEAASMVPYLAAIGPLVTSGSSLPQTALVLAGYCAIMVLPALLLLAVRLALDKRITPLLQRIETWMTLNANETLAWVLFLLGLFLASDAIS